MMNNFTSFAAINLFTFSLCLFSDSALASPLLEEENIEKIKVKAGQDDLHLPESKAPFIPMLFKTGYVNLFEKEDEEIDLNDASHASENLSQLASTPFHLGAIEQYVESKDLEEIYPYADNLYSLNLTEAGLTNDTLKSLSHFTQLRTLNLNDNRFNDEGLEDFKNFVNLQNLFLVYNKITKDAFPYLSALKNLETLNLDSTYLENEGIQSLVSHIPQLKELNVRSCGFNESVLDDFLKMPNLKVLNISFNRINKKDLERFMEKAKEKEITVINESEGELED